MNGIDRKKRAPYVRKGLTTRQKEFLGVLAWALYRGERNSLRELVAATGNKAVGAAHRLMTILMQMGMVQSLPDQGWVPTEAGYTLLGWKLKKCKSCKSERWVPV